MTWPTALWINDKLWIDDTRLPGFDPNGRIRPGVGGYVWWEDEPIAFDLLKLRKLDAFGKPMKPGPPSAPR